MKKSKLSLVRGNFKVTHKTFGEILDSLKDNFTEDELNTPMETVILGGIDIISASTVFWSDGSTPRDIAYLTDKIKFDMLQTEH